MLVFLGVMNNSYHITQLPNVSYILFELHFGQITLASRIYRPHRLKLVASDLTAGSFGSDVNFSGFMST